MLRPSASTDKHKRNSTAIEGARVGPRNSSPRVLENSLSSPLKSRASEPRLNVRELSAPLFNLAPASRFTPQIVARWEGGEPRKTRSEKRPKTPSSWNHRPAWARSTLLKVTRPAFAAANLPALGLDEGSYTCNCLATQRSSWRTPREGPWTTSPAGEFLPARTYKLHSDVPRTAALAD